jgi:hypothetical protein
MSKSKRVLGCLFVVVGVVGCGSSAQCPMGYGRVGDRCVELARTDAGAPEGDGAIADGGPAPDGATGDDAAMIGGDAEPMADAGAACAMVTYYEDADGDGHGDPATGAVACAIPDGAVDNGDDCDDADAERHPSAVEICDDIDQDCDGDAIEPDLRLSFFADEDGDTFGDPMHAILACAALPGYVADSRDCNDASPFVHPDSPEVCNEIDDNCDGVINEHLPLVTYYRDADGDGLAPLGAMTRSYCALPVGYTVVDPAIFGQADCADGDSRAFFGETEYFTGDVNGRPGNQDFNCDVHLEAQFPGYGFCTANALDCRGRTGFLGAQPICGTAAQEYQVSCALQLVGGVATCVSVTDARRQGCR